MLPTPIKLNSGPAFNKGSARFLQLEFKFLFIIIHLGNGSAGGDI